MELANPTTRKRPKENHYKRWEESGFFAPRDQSGRERDALFDRYPAANVTGSLHMGHALQHTIMDALVRWKRSAGLSHAVAHGTDHGGIYCPAKVVEQLKKDEHKKPTDIGR